MNINIFEEIKSEMNEFKLNMSSIIRQALKSGQFCLVPRYTFDHLMLNSLLKKG